ncbi:hypothetical protein ABKA04_001947 [Annulohypoxylon sp. FPYF3050]
MIPTPHAGISLAARIVIVDNNFRLAPPIRSTSPVVSGLLYKSSPSRCAGVATICVAAGTINCATSAFAWAVCARLSGMIAETCGAMAKVPNTVMISRARNAALTDNGVPRGTSARLPTAAVTAEFPLLLGLGAAVMRFPKNWANLTSFQTLKGVFTTNTAEEIRVPRPYDEHGPRSEEAPRVCEGA